MTIKEIKILQDEYQRSLEALRSAESVYMTNKKKSANRLFYEIAVAQELVIFDIALKLNVDELLKKNDSEV